MTTMTSPTRAGWERPFTPLTAYLPTGRKQLDPRLAMPGLAEVAPSRLGRSVMLPRPTDQARVWHSPVVRPFGTILANHAALGAPQSLRASLSAMALLRVPNRPAFEERLGTALRTANRAGEPFAVLAVAIDGTETVAAQQGVRTAERLLESIGPRLAAAVREWDSVARLGAEQFGLLLPGVSAVTVGELSRRVAETLSQPFIIDGQRLRIGARLGVALYPQHGTSGQTLLQQALADAGEAH